MKICAFLLLLASLAPAQDVQKQGEALLEHARQLSSIRYENAPAFRLKATFSFNGVNLETVKGTYTEVWVSNSKWRREFSANDMARVEVGEATRHWILDTSKDFSEHATQVTGALQPLPSSRLDFGSVVQRSEHGVAAECAVTKAGPQHVMSAFCFDKKSGLPLETVSPEIRPRNILDRSCSYGGFQKFGTRWVPHDIVCFEDRHRSIDVTITELTPEPSPDPALFTPPPGAIELGTCSGTWVFPEALWTPAATLPFGSEVRLPPAEIWLVIDSKGKPQNARILRSAGEAMDQKALKTVYEWNFKPGKCDGKPMPSATILAIPFLFRRF